jgi:hypothetical protein
VDLPRPGEPVDMRLFEPEPLGYLIDGEQLGPGPPPTARCLRPIDLVEHVRDLLAHPVGRPILNRQ